MSVLELFDDRRQFAAQSLVEPDTENLADAIGRQPPEPEFTASLEDLADGKVAFEDEVAVVLDMRDSVDRDSFIWLRSFLENFGPNRNVQQSSCLP